MSQKKSKTAATTDIQVDENPLYACVAEIIETRTFRAWAYANREVTLMY